MTRTCGVDERLVDERRPDAEQLGRAAPPPPPAPVMPAGGADSVSGTSSRPTSPAVRWSSQRHAIRSTHSGGFARVGRAARSARRARRRPSTRRATRRPSSPAISTRFDEDRGGGLRLLVRVGPRERDARLAGPARVVCEQQLVRVGGRRAAHAGDAHPVVGQIFEARGREVGDDVGRQVARRVVHLVEQLVAQRVGAHPAARARGLRDHRGAVGFDVARSDTAGPTGGAAPTSRRE